MKTIFLFFSLLMFCFLGVEGQVPDLPLSFTNEEVRRFKESVEPYCVQYHEEENEGSERLYKRRGIYKPYITRRGERVDINVLHKESRISIENGYYYIYKIEAPNVQHLEISFDNFFLSYSSYMFIYNEFNYFKSVKKLMSTNYSDVVIIGSNPVQGNQLIIEVFELENNHRPNNIRINEIMRVIK
ncbi:MAG: hypothetical protein ACPGVB_14045 [Chitinophagales bacterium]